MSESTTRLLARLAASAEDSTWAVLVERHLGDMRRSAASAAGSGFADLAAPLPITPTVDRRPSMVP